MKPSLLSLFLWVGVASVLAAPARPAASAPGTALQSLGGVPLHFEDLGGPRGLSGPFRAQARDHTILLDGNQVQIAFHRRLADRGPAGGVPPSRRQPAAALADDAEHWIQLTLLGASTVPLIGSDTLPGVANYFVGANATEWRTRIPLHAKVVGRGIYPGVDVVYYGTGERLEFDFVVAPGGNPSTIGLRVDGARSVRVDASGDLVIESEHGELRQHKPVAYQIISGVRRLVSASYRMRDRTSVGFAMGTFDPAHPLVIDPILSYSTFFGGERQDAAWSVKVDGGGNIIFAGETRSQNFRIRATPGAYQTRYAGGKYAAGDGFVAKLNAAGTAFDYITYLGGTADDAILGLTLDTMGNAYVAGLTDSTNFPVTAGAFQTENAGTNDPVVNVPFTDAFIAKLDPTGSALIYSTYLGGDGADTAFGIAVDSAGRAHVAGATGSGLVFLQTNLVCTTVCTNLVCGPTTCETNALYTGSPGPTFVVTNVAFVTNGMSIDVVETFITTTPISVTPVSVGFPVVNPIQANNGGIISYTHKKKLYYVATNDAFVCTLSADGSTLLFSTYLGGTNSELATGIALDSAGRVVITGPTASWDFPISNALQPINYGVQSAFVAKLDTAASALVFSTFLGGSGTAAGQQVALDGSDRVYVVGSKNGASFPSTPRAYNRGGIFKSATGGELWLPADDGIDHPQVQALALDGSAPLTVFAGTDRGVFRTTDGGVTWNSRSLGITNLVVNALAIDPTDSGRIYAGTAGAVYRTRNGGITWMNSSSNLNNNENVTAFAIDPGAPSTLYCGTRHGVFKSTDGADSWSKSSDGIGNAFINAVAIHPTNSALIFAATEGGVYKNTNAATGKWTAQNRGLGATRVKALALDPVNVATLYAATTRGIYQSTDGAENWELRTNGIGKPFAMSLAIDPANSSRVFTGTTNGVFVTTNAGLSWAASSNGLFTNRVASLALDASTSPLTLYAGMLGTNSFGGTNDLFLARLTPDGQSLDYSVVVGGTKNDQGFAVAVGPGGNAYLTGITDSPKFPVVQATNTQARLAGRTDAIVVQFNEDASLLRYSFYLGGGSTDYGLSIALDPSENVYVGGYTYSGSFPKSTNAIQRTISGNADAFVTRIAPLFPPAPPARR